jgi:hypothetical protein
MKQGPQPLSPFGALTLPPAATICGLAEPILAQYPALLAGRLLAGYQLLRALRVAGTSAVRPSTDTSVRQRVQYLTEMGKRVRKCGPFALFVTGSVAASGG